MSTTTLKISEDQLQRQCVKWFRMQYPKLEKRLFAIPNGGKRDVVTAAKIFLDCLQRVKAITNDNLCCKIVLEKFIDKDNPMAEIKLFAA